MIKSNFNISEFKERYINNHEEFCFLYKDMKIEFVCEKSCYPVVIQYKDGTIKQYEFKSPKEALDKIKINGKNLEDIWDDLV